ncbi:MAG TPA: type IV-A pilus assembly ATPase PilB [Candidatus Edwardsbacteria bacterium]|nr:type IV-A pilus assembly ATPase PilB [Candidatus Edwardsbacteria bacterium]
MAIKLGDMLVQADLIKKEQLDKALAEQKSTGARLGACLIKMGFITEDAITDFLGKQLGVPTVNLGAKEIDPALLKLIPADTARKFQIVPVQRTGRTLFVAMSNPADVFTIEDIQFLTGFEVKPMVCAETSIEKTIDRLYGTQASADALKALDAEATDNLEVVDKNDEEVATQAEIDSTPVVKLVQSILMDAIKKGASDIHIEPYEKVLRVRFRMDGVLQEVMSPPRRIAAAVASRIKVLSKLNLTERRLPQDGRCSVKLADRNVDLRVSTMPIKYGEKICIRVLEQSALGGGLTTLGIEGKALNDFVNATTRPQGMILVTGPTGSGKTRTLYSAIYQLNKPGVNIVTAEDPVEYDMMGINQVNVQPEIGYTFEKALKAFLRQDPNIVLVGEIRDRGTGEIAMTAAMTGHLVLSTLHTNDAPSTLNRLLDMEIPPFLIAATVTLIEAQRLVRRVCKSCKAPVPLEEYAELIRKMGVDPATLQGVQFMRGKGCAECNQTGYKGRVGIFEVLPVGPEIRRMIIARKSTDEIRAEAERLGMLSLRQAVLDKAKQGLTTLEEAVRETVSE